jgi:RND family efflux transporter MFP subunit
MVDDRLTSDLASLRIDRSAPASSSGSRRGLLWILALALVGGGGFAAWRVAEPMLEAKLFKTEVSVTEIALVSPSQAQSQLTSTGYVVPQVQVDVSSKLVGRVDKATIREGSVVKEGQVIFTLDASDQKVQIASGQARVASARARAATARAQQAEIAQQVEREKRLVESGSMGKATLDDLKARLNSLDEQVKAADADVKASDSEVAALTVNLGNTTIKAPVDGTVITKPLQPGDVITPGLPMARIADFSSIVVETDVPEVRLHLVKKGGPCEIVLDAYPERRWRGEVVEVSPSLNRSKASATVKVRFLDRDDTVLPEMAARVSFLEAPLDESKLKEPAKKIVPGGAVAERAGSRVVFVLDSGKIRQENVTLGPKFGDGFELLDGPAPGTKIVSEPSASLADGQSVKEKSL